MSSLLAAFQQADSAFPSGSFAFSNGIEGLAAAGLLDGRAAIGTQVLALLRHRWAPFERPALVRAHRAAADLEAVAALDREVEASSLCAPLRLGSRRNGQAFLIAHDRLATPGAAAYRQRLKSGTGFGHLAVMQGLIWSALGLVEAVITEISLYATASSLLTALVRLGRLGALEAQAVLTEVLTAAAPLCSQPVADDGPLVSCVPLTEIAAMRQDRAAVRFFSS